MEEVGFSYEVVEAVRILLASDAWQRFFVPSLEATRNDWRDSLMDPADGRKMEKPDDYIRGCVATINWFLDLPQALIDEADAQRARRDEAQVQVDAYAHRADLGTP